MIREVEDLFRAKGEIVFYAEHKNYYPYLEGLVKELGIDNVSYVSSDPDDITKDFYLNKLFPLFMAFVNCKVFIMTMTDLNLFHIRRSIHPVHYVYVFHSPVSTHMMYRFGAFDHYDSILCVGPHQVGEIRTQEMLYGLKPKRLVEAGYYRLEKLYEAYKRYNKKDREVTVLVAPGWGSPNLLEVCSQELLEALLSKGYKVILRLHPETVKRRQFASYDGVTLETSVTSMNSLVEADVLITDWSGVALEYALGTERPVISIDTPPKVHNPRYRELGIEPIESLLRREVGVVVQPNDVKGISTVIQEVLNEQGAWKDKLAKLRGKYIFNFGKSSEVGANYIKRLL